MPPKRASTAADTDGTTRKRARASAADAHAPAQALVAAVLNDAHPYALPDDDAAVLADMAALAQYARHLEAQLGAAQTTAAATAQAAKKSPEQLAEAAEKIRKAAAAGIKKQMTWKPSCKTNSAKWVYDGVCPDPEVFGHLFKLDKPPTWKMKKFSKSDFEDIFGHIVGHCRYNDLYITDKDINVRWSDSGEFKLSGTYGIV